MLDGFGVGMHGTAPNKSVPLLMVILLLVLQLQKKMERERCMPSKRIPERLQQANVATKNVDHGGCWATAIHTT